MFWNPDVKLQVLKDPVCSMWLPPKTNTPFLMACRVVNMHDGSRDHTLSISLWWYSWNWNLSDHTSFYRKQLFIGDFFNPHTIDRRGALFFVFCFAFVHHTRKTAMAWLFRNSLLCSSVQFISCTVISGKF